MKLEEINPLQVNLRSLDWHLKAAQGGHPSALFDIGQNLHRLTYDDITAYAFLILAKKRAKESFDYYDFITSEMQDVWDRNEIDNESLKEAQALADLWERNHPDAAKEWPSDSWVFNMKGEGAKLIPPVTTPPTEKTFCDIFGDIVFYCPQYTDQSPEIIKTKRPGRMSRH